MMTPSRNQITKTYFVTKDFENRFPPDFIASQNEKYIVVQQVKVLYKNMLIGDVELHSDFIQRDAYCDHFVMFANEQPQSKYRKYKFIGKTSTFRVWFTDIEGNMIAPVKNEHGEPDKDFVFVLQMMFIY